MSEVVTLTLAESAEVEDAADAAITAAEFQPQATLTAQPPQWDAETVYAHGDLVTQGGVIYRSKTAGENEGNDPSTDEGGNWVAAPVSVIQLQNPAYNDGPALIPPGTPYP